MVTRFKARLQGIRAAPGRSACPVFHYNESIFKAIPGDCAADSCRLTISVLQFWRF
jgi:hypothetical protein